MNTLGTNQPLIVIGDTLFDALVAATAKKLNTKIIFSFDDWYEKLGFKLASDL